MIYRVISSRMTILYQGRSKREALNILNAVPFEDEFSYIGEDPCYMEVYMEMDIPYTGNNLGQMRWCEIIPRDEEIVGRQ
jgi:hypothetical protein